MQNPAIKCHSLGKRQVNTNSLNEPKLTPPNYRS
uniref:Uncharacterized protein n=1 Tax=Rhizophora mucronata TaxID=61149 RepID=A0A2P2QW59_RHIMU